MGKNDYLVKEKLGQKAWEILIEKTKDGTITSQHMKDLSQFLDSTVGGNHSRRVNDQKKSCDDFEMREILSDWWDQKLYKLDQSEALNKISDILNSPEVNLPSVASKLSPGSAMNPLEITLASIKGMLPNESLLSSEIKKIFDSIPQDQEPKEMKTAADVAEAYNYIDQQFKIVVRSFMTNKRYARDTIKQVEDNTGDSFQISKVKMFLFEEQTVQGQNMKDHVRDRLKEVKDSRLMLLIMQILRSPEEKRKVRQVISEFKTHLDAYSELEENFNLKENEKEMRQQLEASEKRLRQEMEEKAALQRELETMRAKSFMTKRETRRSPSPEMATTIYAPSLPRPPAPDMKDVFSSLFKKPKWF